MLSAPYAFSQPKKTEVVWLCFVSDGHVTAIIKRNDVVCMQHFIADSFENFGQYTAGLASRVCLTDEGDGSTFIANWPAQSPSSHSSVVFASSKCYKNSISWHFHFY